MESDASQAPVPEEDYLDETGLYYIANYYNPNRSCSNTYWMICDSRALIEDELERDGLILTCDIVLATSLYVTRASCRGRRYRALCGFSYSHNRCIVLGQLWCCETGNLTIFSRLQRKRFVNFRSIPVCGRILAPPCYMSKCAEF